MMRLAILFACILGAVPARAQPLRSLVVPGDATVVIAPRGRPSPALPRPAYVAVPALPPVAAAPLAGGMDLAAGAPVLLPLVAALLLGAASPGSGGSTSAPSTTR